MQRSPGWEHIVGTVSNRTDSSLLFSLSPPDCNPPSFSSVRYFKRRLEIEDVTRWSPACLIAFIEKAAVAPYVHRIAIGAKYHSVNLESRGVTETGVTGHEDYRKLGLTGSGQVVGVADSGLDDLSCFFADDSGAYLSSYTNRSGALEPLRRKVIQYVSYADDSDYLGGHGTHVVGSIVGSSSSDFTRLNGIAPDAKVTFFDIGERIGQRGSDGNRQEVVILILQSDGEEDDALEGRDTICLWVWCQGWATCCASRILMR